MANMLAVIAAGDLSTQAVLAAEALRKAAAALGHTIQVGERLSLRLGKHPHHGGGPVRQG
ncbi:hypothetical protein GAY28_38440 [Azospirillum brasilense]|nr:hypothetical protein [Azospirillum brasilense]